MKTLKNSYFSIDHPPERSFVERDFSFFTNIFLSGLQKVLWGLGKINDNIFGLTVRFLEQFEIKKQ